VENYITDCLLYKENSKVVEKSLPNEIDGDNEADSKLGDGPEVSFNEDPIVAYLNDPDCYNSAGNGNG